MAFPETYDECVPIEFLGTVELIDYDRIELMILANKDAVCECSSVSSGIINTRLDSVEGGIRQLISEVVDEVNENQTIIESNGLVFKVII